MQTASPSKSHAIVALISFALFFLFLGHQQLFFAHEQTFIVLRNDAARECYTRSNSKFERLFGWDEYVRSERPKIGYGQFCGAIRTDMGPIYSARATCLCMAALGYATHRTG